MSSQNKPIVRANPTENSLTRFAILTLISNLLIQGAMLLSRLIITPILVSGLGGNLYGAWIILQNSIGFILAFDLRSSATLRFNLGTHQHDPDIAYKKRQIGAALISWGVISPIFVLIGIPVTIFAPQITSIEADFTSVVRQTMIILVCWIILDRLFSIPSAILRAVNLEFKAMGLKALVTFLSSLLSAVAIWLGLGLPGLAVSLIIASLINGILHLIIAQRTVYWFGVAIASLQEIRSFLSFSSWLLLDSMGNLLMFASQYILIGILFGPIVASIYSLTGASIKLLASSVQQLLNSADAGLAEIVGRKEWEHLEKVRSEIQVLSFVLMLFMGINVILLNQSFLQLWVGKEFFGGTILTTMIWASVTLQVVLRVDIFLAQAMGLVRATALSITVSGMFSLIMAIALSSTIGIWGIALGIIMSSSVLILYQWYLISTVTDFTVQRKIISFSRSATVGTILIVISIIVEPSIKITGWLEFFGIGFATASSSIVLIWFLALDYVHRQKIIKRIQPHLSLVYRNIVK